MPSPPTGYINWVIFDRVTHLLSHLKHQSTLLYNLNMSDTTRQSLTEKAGAAVKPSSQKSTCEGATDWVKGKVDSVASTIEPNNQKSTSQSAGDALSGNSNENSESLVNKAKSAVGLDK